MHVPLSLGVHGYSARSVTPCTFGQVDPLPGQTGPEIPPDATDKDEDNAVKNRLKRGHQSMIPTPMAVPLQGIAAVRVEQLDQEPIGRGTLLNLPVMPDENPLDGGDEPDRLDVVV